MAAMSWEAFERYKQRGLDARRAGQWDSARIYLLEAARAMIELSKDSIGPELTEARQQTAAKLLDLAKDCQDAKKNNRAPNTARPKAEGAAEQEGQGGADQWIVKEKPTIKFADVAGLDSVKEDIRMKMIYPMQNPDLAKKFGVRLGGGILLYGPPGTGKTMLAKATAAEVDATFFRVSAADLLSKWVGEAEQNIKKLFDAAAGEQRAIIFLDEIEALIPARREDGATVMQRVVPQILQGMEGFDKKSDRAVLFMGATNTPWQLDSAVLRPGRFDDKVYISPPDQPARRKLLDMYLAFRPVATDVDYDHFAQRLDGYSGADIRYVCDRSATIPFMHSLATGEDGSITTAILEEVITATPRSITPESIRRFEQWGQTTNS
jgi:transitional endoplasmic reticulum ATPase